MLFKFIKTPFYSYILRIILLKADKFTDSSQFCLLYVFAPFAVAIFEKLYALNEIIFTSNYYLEMRTEL